MEGIGRVAAVGSGVGEGADQLQELHDRPGPAVDQQQRGGLWFGGADMEEVHGGPVEGGGELGVLVEPGLVLAPVVAAAPVFGQVLEVPEGDPAGSAGVGELVGPAGSGQPLLEVVQVGLGDLDPERSQVAIGGVGAGHGRIPLHEGVASGGAT
jgi:hypothetical protein